jgi:hypothetical protein
MSVAAAPHSAALLLGLPVRVHGSRVGRTADILVDVRRWRVLGFVVECGDDVERFLPFAASQPAGDEIAVGSALMLLDDVGFYRARTASLRAMLGAEIERSGRIAGTLVDLVVARTAEIDELALDVDGAMRRVPAGGSSVVTPSSATAA